MPKDKKDAKELLQLANDILGKTLESDTSHFSQADRDMLITMHGDVKNLTNDTSEIKSQTTKTNGRVGSLERSRTQMWTAVAIIVFFGSAFIALAMAALDARIEKGVRNVLSEYEIHVK